MSLDQYFQDLIRKVEESDIDNQGKDKGGFYKPTRTVLLRHLNLLKDLHAKPLAKPMLRTSWNSVVEDLPPEWLILTDEQKREIKKMLE